MVVVGAWVVEIEVVVSAAAAVVGGVVEVVGCNVVVTSGSIVEAVVSVAREDPLEQPAIPRRAATLSATDRFMRKT